MMTATISNVSEVLVVEDDEAILSLLQRIGTRKGARVIGVSSLEQALSFVDDAERLQELRVVFLDLNVFGGSSLHLYHRVRNVTRDLPVVFMSGNMDRIILQKILDEDVFAALLPKPFEVTAFESVLTNPLGAVPRLVSGE